MCIRDRPKAVTMLFTNAYMSNPSSLFGHTLFRIDTKRKGTQLLAHGANFGADTGDETGVLYALKGLWGGYYGTFGIKPYYLSLIHIFGLEFFRKILYDRAVVTRE